MMAQARAVAAGLPRPTFSHVVNALLTGEELVDDELLRRLADEMRLEGLTR
jgi:hypothetical protein